MLQEALSFVQSNGDFAVLWQCFFCCSLQKGAESGPSARLLGKNAVAEQQAKIDSQPALVSNWTACYASSAVDLALHCDNDVLHSRSLSSVLLWVNLYMGQYQVTKCLLRPLKFLVFLALIHHNRTVLHRHQSEHPIQAYWWVVIADFVCCSLFNVHSWLKYYFSSPYHFLFFSFL